MQLSQVPAQLVEAWATGDSTKTNPIPVPSQIGITPGAASYTDGFPPLCATPLASGGIPPSKADMNGALYQMSAVDVWMCAGGGFPYNSTFQTAIGGYPKGARVLMASGNGYWVSTVDDNVSDPDTGGAGWASADDNAITALTGPVTASGPGVVAATITPTGVTAGSYTGANITVNAAGQVTAAANGVVSATINDVSGSRSFGVAYQNTSGAALMVCGYGQITGGSGDSQISCSIGASSPSAEVWANTQTSTGSGKPVGFCFPPIPDGWFYRVDVVGIISSTPVKCIESPLT